MLCCKLKEWVWTETGKGDRLGGDSRVGPSPLSERPAPLHSLQTRTERDQGPASFRCRPVCATAACSAFALPCSPASAITHACYPICICPCVSIHHHVRQDRPVFCKDCPAGSHTTGTALSNPCTVFCIVHPFLFISRGKPGTALGSRLLSCPCIGSQRLHLGSLATLFKWPVGRRMACRVRVSCLHQLGV